MKNTLIDTGPLIALFDTSDKFHENIKRFLKDYKPVLVTTWPVLTETCHLLKFNYRVQVAFLEWINRGAIDIRTIQQLQITELAKLIERYSNVPMDLVDASLIWLAENENIRDIITFDSDYYIYRTKNKKALTNIFPFS